MLASDHARQPSWAIIFLCFFFSGAAGLIYEVLWLRMLGLVFGHTVYAITTVLAAFMAGLALGSLIFARLAGRIRNLIRVYGWLEIGIGFFCVLLPMLLELASSIYLSLQRTLTLSYDTFSFMQFLIVFALLMVPTTLMGGTLPILSQAVVKLETELGRAVGTLYAVNTFGAVTGVLLAGYVLLPALGNRATLAIAVAANVAIGLLALAYSRNRQASSSAEEAVRSVPADPARQEALGFGARLTVAALAVSGAVAMIYEVAWTRALALVIGSSTYAFTAMLVAFLLGIAGGSALYSWFWRTRRPSPLTFAALQAGIGLSVVLILLVFERMPEFFLTALHWSDSPAFVQVLQFMVSAGSLLLSTLLIGATFPCAVAVVARGACVGRDVGHVYALNTMGAIAGAVLAGFALIPAIGAHASLKVGIATNFFVAAMLAAAAPSLPPLWRWSSIVATFLVILNVWLILPWDPRVMSSGPAIYAKKYFQEAARMSLAEALKGRQLLFYRDGISSTVSVSRDGPIIALQVNGKTDASTARDMVTQLMAGHLPLLLHRDPQAVLVIGLGSGVTVGAVARHPTERIDVAEIEPAVVEASRFFAREHGDVLKNPRVRTVIADGRNFLLTTAAQYDVIISEPSNPWIGGLASLFSVEFYRLARERLRPEGVMLQWVQAYNLQPEDLQMVVKTFRTVFPDTTIWGTLKGDFLLLGRAESAPLDLDVIEARFKLSAEVRRDLDRLGIEAWPGLLGYFMLSEEDTARFSADAGLNTDDRLPLEFSAPRALYLETTDRNWALVRSFRKAEFPTLAPDSLGELEQPLVRYWIGMGYLGRREWEEALAHFQRALQLDPQHAPSMLGAGAASIWLGRPAAALDLARKVLRADPSNAQAFYLAGRASEALKTPADAVPFFEKAVSLQPANRIFQLALKRAQAGEPVQ